jgi:hypothetical protein
MSNNEQPHNDAGSENGSNAIQDQPEAPAVNDFGNLEQLVNSAIVLPLARANLLDYLYAYGIPVMNLGMHDRGIDEMASIISRSLYDSRPVKRVMPEEKEKEITETTFNKEQAEEQKINTSCGIWQIDFEEGEPIKILPCNHAFKADAITKWLTTEKAECPICRFALESKEVIVHSSSHQGGEAHEPNDEVHYQPRAEMPPAVDEQRVRENNILSRQNNMINGGAYAHGGGNDPARSVYAAAHASRQSVAMPINQLIQNRRYMIENIARASGGVGVNRRWLFGSNQAVAPVEAEPVRAARPEAQGSANPPGSNNMIHEARAEPGNRGNRDYNYINYINNINIYNVNRENDNNYDDVDDDDDGYNIINNINNNRVSFQEQADIEEAIRRSLMD